MKRIFIIIVSLLFCTTIYAKSTYAEAQNLANDYIKKFPNYQRYFVTKNTNFGFNTSNSIVNNSDFKSGGLINEQEYRIASGSINSSYLFNGLTYFTMTESGGQVKVIDPTASSGINSLNKISATSGVRVTNYVSDEVKLRGVGTRVSPWKFIERYNVTFEYDDSKISVSPSTTTIAASTENVSGTAKVTVTPTAQYTYVPQTTCGTIDSNGVLIVTGITRDTVCRIDSTLREYTVSIDANGGTFKSNMNSELGWTLTDGNTKATKKIIYSEKIGTLPSNAHIERIGYTFDGIFNGATVINSNMQITNDTSLTVKWKGNKYKVTYNANGGSISPEYVELTYGDPYTGLHTPTKTGYNFVGWYKDSSLTTKIEEGTTILNTASDHTIYAKWEARKFTVTYNANGGSGTMSNSEAIYDTNFVTRQNTYTRTGYTFNGWNEKADGTGTKWALTSNGVYENGNGTHPWKWTYTNNITLYAQWLQNVSIPNASTYCDNKTYNGKSQTIVKSAATGFEWKSGSSQTNASTYTVTAAIKSGYIWADGTTSDKSISCTISKANPTINITAKTATYTGNPITANTATVTLVNNETYSGTITYTYYNGTSCSGTALSSAPTNVGNYSVRASIASQSNYNAAEKCVTHTIAKKNTSLTLSPSSGTLTYGTNGTVTITTDGDGTLSCKSNNTSIAKCSISGKALTIVPQANNSDDMKTTIIIEQTAGTNYNAGSASYSVTVNRKSLTAPSSPSNKTYNGSEQASGITCPSGSTSGGDTKKTNVGNYTQTCTAQSGYKFGSSNSCSVSWKIVARTVTVTAPVAVSGTLTYSGSGQNLLSSVGSCSAGGTMYYYSSNPTTSSSTPTFSTSSGWTTTAPTTSTYKGTNAGTYYMYYYCRVTDTTNNNGTNINTVKSVSKTIGKATAVAPTLSNTTVTYDGTRKYISESGGTSGLTKQYAYRKTSSDSWSAWGTTAGYHSDINASSWQMKAKTIGNDNYNDSSESSVATLTINAKSVAVSWGSTTSFTFDGSAHAPTASVNTGVSGETMTVTRTTGTNVGSYTSTASCSSVSGGQAKCSNYSLTSTTKAYTISALKNATTGSCASGLVFSGSAQTLASGAANASYSNNSKTDAGTYSVTVTATANHAFSDGNTSKTLSCTISPKQLSAPSPSITTAGKVTWGAVSNASSYQVSINGGTWTTSTSGSSSIPTTTNGTHTAAVRAVGSGNYATSSSSSASATISDKITVSWSKSEKSCNGSYSWVYEDTQYLTACNGTTTMSCNKESDVNNAWVTCSADRWTKTTKTCTENESTDTINKACNTSCPSGYTLSSNTCSTKYTKKIYKCNCYSNGGEAGGNDPACSFVYSSTQYNVGCSAYALSCTKKSHVGNTKVTCTNAKTTGGKVCTKTTTTYSTSTSTSNNQTSCSASSGFTTCNSSSVSKKNVTCTPSRYAKVIKNCTGSYSWGSTSTATVSSCSSNNISCGSSTVGQTYRACSRNYGCGSGTSAIGSKCIKIN